MQYQSQLGESSWKDHLVWMKGLENPFVHSKLSKHPQRFAIRYSTEQILLFLKIIAAFWLGIFLTHLF